MRAQPIYSRAGNARNWALAFVGCAVLAMGACFGPSSTQLGSIGVVATVVPSPTAHATTGPSTPGLPAGFPLMMGIRADDPLPMEPGLVGRWTTEANGADVFAFLESALPRAGYHVDLLGPGDAVAVIRFTPPGGQQLQIDLGQAGIGTGSRTYMELRLPRD